MNSAPFFGKLISVKSKLVNWRKWDTLTNTVIIVSEPVNLLLTYILYLTSRKYRCLLNCLGFVEFKTDFPQVVKQSGPK